MIAAERTILLESSWTAQELNNLAASVFKPTDELTQVVYPPTGERLTEVPVTRADAIPASIDRLKNSQFQWEKSSIEQRSAIMLRFHDLVFERKDKILDLLQLETGKARHNALEEVFETAISARYYALRAKKWLKSKRRNGAVPFFTKTRMQYVPVGLVGIISPWNYPLSIPISDAIPALLAGNAVLLKPSELTPLSALYARKLLIEAGLPEDVFTIVNGYGADLGPALITASDYIAFTGSTRTGRIIGKMAGEQLKKCSLELGGKNPLIALEDVPAQKLAEGVINACFSNTGQLCVSIEQIYLPKKRFDELSSAMVEEVRAMKTGPTISYDSHMGSLVSRDHTDKVMEHLLDAEAKGASVLCGGSAASNPEACYVAPTLLTNVSADMHLYKEETFGPVVALYAYENLEQLIQQLNASNYGLNASVWGKNVNQAQKVAQKLRFGTVNINEGYAAGYGSVDATMGGFRESGVGRRHAEEGFYKYTEAVNISEQRILPVGPSKQLNGKSYENLMSKAIRAMRYLPGIR